MATTHNGESKPQDAFGNYTAESDNDSDDDDGDLEELVERYTAELRHSVSAHANLTASRISVKKSRSAHKSLIVEEDSEDSDEEFYIHKALEPLRKSKSCYTTSMFASTRGEEEMTVADKIDFTKGDVLTFRIVPSLHPGTRGTDNECQLSDDEPVDVQRRCWSEPNDSKNPSEVGDSDLLLKELDLLEPRAGGEKLEMERSWSSPSRFEVAAGLNSSDKASFEPVSALNGSKLEEKRPSLCPFEASAGLNSGENASFEPVPTQNGSKLEQRGPSPPEFSPHRPSNAVSLEEDRMSTSSDEPNLTDDEGSPEAELGQIAPLLGQISTNRLRNSSSCSIRPGIWRPPRHSATFTGSAVEEHPGTLMKLGELRQSLARTGGFQRSASAFAGSLASPMLRDNSWLRPLSVPEEVKTASRMSPFAPNFNESLLMADEDAPSLWMPVVISKTGNQKAEFNTDNGNDSACTSLSEEAYHAARRSSPPLAVSDELSESQISELEREIEEHGLAYSLGTAHCTDVQDREWKMDELVLDREATLTDPWPICHEMNQMAQSCYYPGPGEEEAEDEDAVGISMPIPIAWSASTPCFGQEERGVSVNMDGRGQRRRRRVLPKLPHERETTTTRSDVMSQVVTKINSFSSIQQLTTSATQTPNRRLPEIPKVQIDHLLDQSESQTTSVLTQPRPSTVMNFPLESRPFDAIPSETADVGEQPLHSLDPDASPITPTALMRNALTMIIEQNAPHAHHHHHSDHPQTQGQYQLSYDLATSSLAESTMTASGQPEPSSSHKPNRYGLMEDSYYEDGLNGNLVPSSSQSWPIAPPGGITPSNSGDAMRTAGDSGADSSGISSCCTSHTNENNSKGNIGDSLETGRQNDPNVPTHRAQFPFVPRHSDELRLEMGDPIHVHQLHDDHWCSGTNLRTQQQGIFPSAHICEVDLVEEICHGVLPPTSHPHTKPSKSALTETDTFYLTMLASIEVAHHKGNDVLMQAIGKVCAMYQQKDEIMVPQTVLMEISFRGIHVIDKRKKDFFRCPTFDYFYSLQNISFCGAHPKQLRYFGFITKHPLLPRFACHVFLSQDSTQPIVEAIGRAFKRSYDEYMAFAHPTEDIFIE